jgi:hypothetical protein
MRKSEAYESDKSTQQNPREMLRVLRDPRAQSTGKNRHASNAG